jgi:hypothetical protein
MHPLIQLAGALLVAGLGVFVLADLNRAVRAYSTNLQLFHLSRRSVLMIVIISGVGLTAIGLVWAVVLGVLGMGRPIR